MFTFITVFESILEYGWLLNGIVYNLPLSHILCYVFGYYIGKLFSKPFTLPKKLLAIMCITSFFITLMTIIGHSYKTNFISDYTRIVLLSIVLHSVEDTMKQRRNCKRLLHLIGLGVSPLAVTIPNTLFIIGNLVALAALYGYDVEFCLIDEKQKEDHIADIKIYRQTKYNKNTVSPL